MNINLELPLCKIPEISNFYSKNESIILNHGDTRLFLKSIPSNTIQFIITSPPYNIGKEYEKKVDIEKYLKEQDEIIDDIIRVLKEEGSVCWEVGNYVNKSEVYPLDIF